MSTFHSQPEIVPMFRLFQVNRDRTAFRNAVRRRYRRGTLLRLLKAPDAEARCAALAAIGETCRFRATMPVSNLLRDKDRRVRWMAKRTVRRLRFRVGTPQQRQMLRQIRFCNRDELFWRAYELASTLTTEAPEIAETWMQRALALMGLATIGQQVSFTEIADCIFQTMCRNPHHFEAVLCLGSLHALEGDTGDSRKARQLYRRSLRIYPRYRLAVLALKELG